MGRHGDAGIQARQPPADLLNAGGRISHGNEVAAAKTIVSLLPIYQAGEGTLRDTLPSRAFEVKGRKSSPASRLSRYA